MMIKNNCDIYKEYKYLLIRFLERDITPDELGRLQELLENDPSLLEEFKKFYFIAGGVESLAAENRYDSTQAYNWVHSHLKRRRLYAWCMRVAVVVILFGSAYFAFMRGGVMKDDGMLLSENLPEQYGKVFLELGAGNAKELPLDSSDNFTASAFVDSLSLVWDEKQDTLKQWRKLITTKGAMFSMMLSDGSKVWLNAQSVLSYPVDFGDDRRDVFLTGEAYFEVAKDVNRPFFVWIDGVAVEVLGTSFNVSAYEQDSEQRVALLTGSVKVFRSADSLDLVTLSPFQELCLNMENGHYTVQKFTAREVLAWKEGLFVFKNDPLDVVLAQLQRWYDVEFILNEDLAGYRYSGTISRKESIENLLCILRLTNEIEFVMKPDKKIEVIPK